MPPDCDELVELYRARNLSEAHALQASLKAAGLRARVEGDMLQGVVGEVPSGWVTAPRLLVSLAQKDQAQAILLAFLEADQRSRADRVPDACLACSAPMRGADVCENCGWTFDVPTLVPLKSESSRDVDYDETQDAPSESSDRDTNEPGSLEGVVLLLKLVFGIALLFVGVSSLSSLMRDAGQVEEFRMLGRATVVIAEFLFGTMLVIQGARGPRRRR